MKNICFLTALILVVFTSYSQKLITTINTGNKVEGYNFKYDVKSGSFLYTDYDTTAKKNIIMTSKGNSKQYDYSGGYNGVFDSDGNAYYYAYSNVTDTTYKYYMLKNGDEVASFDYIGDGWSLNNDMLYFNAKEEGKSFLVSYNTKTGETSRGKKYDELYLVYFPKTFYEDEPIGLLGFTKDGKPYYAAVEGDSKFLVIGDNEQKRYS